MKKILLSLTTLLVFAGAKAQDVHFSQFYSSPLNLNPAATGLISSKYRVAANYRNQWASISAPYTTMSASFDLPFLYNQLKKNYFGAGIVILSDKSGTGELSNQSIYLSLAYHQKIGNPRHPKHYLSVGAQAGYVQKSVNINKLVFANQYNPLTKGFTNISTETFNAASSFGYADFNLGAMWSSYISEMFSIYGGATVHHITKPQESFLVNVQTGANVLTDLTTFHAGAKIGITDLVYLSPSILYLAQTSASEFTLGSSIGFQVNDNPKEPTAFYAGAYYRLGDAAVALVGFETKLTRIGFSYDFNLSSLHNASNYSGGFELSLVHEGNPSTSPRKVIYCPRF